MFAVAFNLLIPQGNSRKLKRFSQCRGWSKFSVDSNPNMLGLIPTTKTQLKTFAHYFWRHFRINLQNFHLFSQNILHEIYNNTTIRIYSGINYNLSNLPVFPI
jgi:hypothetical protein